jgi:hypothetical protein
MTDKELDDLLRSHKYGDLSSDEAAKKINQSIQERVKEAYDAGLEELNFVRARKPSPKNATLKTANSN